MSDKYVTKWDFSDLSALTDEERDIALRFQSGESLDVDELMVLQTAAEEGRLKTKKTLSGEERRRRRKLLDRDPDHYE